jgi:hypothetical protein
MVAPRAVNKTKAFSKTTKGFVNTTDAIENVKGVTRNPLGSPILPLPTRRGAVRREKSLEPREEFTESADEWLVKKFSVSLRS